MHHCLSISPLTDAHRHPPGSILGKTYSYFGKGDLMGKILKSHSIFSKSPALFFVQGDVDCDFDQPQYPTARSLNCYRWPLSAVGRFRLGGQVWLGIENIKLKETANAVKQLPLKPALLNRVGSD